MKLTLFMTVFHESLDVVPFEFGVFVYEIHKLIVFELDFPKLFN